MKSISVKNFRSIKESGNIEFPKLTLLLGENSIGKSSFLRMFPLLKQSISHSRTEPILWYTPDYVDFGSYNETRSHGTKGSSGIEFDFELEFNKNFLTQVDQLGRFINTLFRSKLENEDDFELYTSLKKDNEIQEYFNKYNPSKKNNDISLNVAIKVFSKSVTYTISVLDHNVSIKHHFNENDAHKDVVTIDKVNIGNYFNFKLIPLESKQLIPEIDLLNIVMNSDSTNDESLSRQSNKEIVSSLLFGTTNKDIETENNEVPARMLSDFDFIPFRSIKEQIDYIRHTLSIDKKIEKTFKNQEEKKGMIYFDFKRQLFSSYAVTLRKIKNNFSEKKFATFSLAAQLNDLIQLINNDLTDSLYNLSYATPVRANAERHYRNQSLSIDSVTPNGENVPTILKNLKENHRKEFDHWQKWTNTSLGIVFDIVSDTSMSSISVQQSGQNSYNLADTGFGYSQMLPIILNLWLHKDDSVESYKTKNKQLALFEQPELHLHPRMQADLMHAIASIAANSKNTGLIMETHSEYMVKQLGHDIAHGILKPNDVQILIFNSENGVAKISKATFLENGSLSNWPTGFFQPEYGV